MTASTRQDTRRAMARVLNQSVQVAAGLKTTLEDERAALESRDLDALENAASNKGSCVKQLTALEQERTGLCKTAGFKADDMPAFVAWCDDRQGIGETWTRLIELAGECDTLNLTNGSIIRSRQTQLGDRFALLRGHPTASDTYGRDGNETAGVSTRSLVEV